MVGHQKCWGAAEEVVDLGQILLGLIVYEPWYQLTDPANTNLET